jgi:hypothetical protein
MSAELRFPARVDEYGNVCLDDPGTYLASVKTYAGKRIVVHITTEKQSRSLNQNRWYWGCVLALISEHTGYEPDELHELFKQRYLPKRLALADDNGVVTAEGVVGGSTARMGTVDFSEYCERVRQFAAEELGVVIPDPVGMPPDPKER